MLDFYRDEGRTIETQGRVNIFAPETDKGPRVWRGNTENGFRTRKGPIGRDAVEEIP